MPGLSITKMTMRKTLGVVSERTTNFMLQTFWRCIIEFYLQDIISPSNFAHALTTILWWGDIWHSNKKNPHIFIELKDIFFKMLLYNKPYFYCQPIYNRADSRFAPSQWEMALLCNEGSHWLGTNLKSALYNYWWEAWMMQSMKTSIHLGTKEVRL